MTTLTRLTAALSLAAASALSVAPSASAAPGDDYFVVNTQDPEQYATSPVVDSGGAFAGCTSVTDLWGAAEQTSSRRVLFFGDKQVNCPGGVVVIHYVAEMNFQSGKRTNGYWYVITDETTLPGADEGGGSVRGDNTRCTPLAPSQFCILDTFSGDVS